MFSLLKTDHFEEWLKRQDRETQAKIQMRLDRIALDSHFGVMKFFDGLIELKWKSGLRVYIARVESKLIVILAGGTKHGQSKDIEKAKKLLKEIKARGFSFT
ncbi:type II toxin-antitoxin system RelE/ParE family toxin [uncultured Bdellovibrio sp.]|uniref:type II toxin-antitoxin system RelE/ParE family toxin n=1 Tax=Bdellovibrio sp. HCB-162 TaxID=3394234 RepID=UPI0025D63749|nr:type II toxin-antitoxin system RelE/ParE family toxin [uncultured Bdellovibrio sp.]